MRMPFIPQASLWVFRHELIKKIEAARIVGDKKIEGLPAVDGYALVGIITISDLINYLIGTLEK